MTSAPDNSSLSLDQDTNQFFPAFWREGESEREKIVTWFVTLRVCLDRTYFAETENLLLKSL